MGSIIRSWTETSVARPQAHSHALHVTQAGLGSRLTELGTYLQQGSGIGARDYVINWSVRVKLTLWAMR